jgi:hypothetical protein
MSKTKKPKLKKLQKEFKKSPNQTTLFHTTDNIKYSGNWTQKQKRAYHRIKSGVKVAHIKNKKIKHLILTTSPAGANRNLCGDFQTLRKRILRKFNILIAYCMVHTNEGNGVLHVLLTGDYLPQYWLSKQWEEIHKSSYVYIKDTPYNVAGYITSQYIANQQTSFQRCSWSHNWVCKGFVKQWKYLLKWSKDWKKTFPELIQKWNLYLSQVALTQKTLDVGLP